ncbi:MAG: selenium metabolism-associated LysR family transcriptional regulator [Pseudomonadota bacterium]
MIDFELKDIEIFCRVVRLGSFSGAAQSLYVAQSSVSERISKLEEKIGARLIDRRSRKILPTRAGRLLYQRGLKLLDVKREIASELDDFLNVARGDILIGSSTIPGEYILPKILGTFTKEHPGIRVNLSIADTSAVTDGVSEGVFEAGIVGSMQQRRGLVFRKLWDDVLVLVVAPGHRWTKKKRVSLPELAGEPFLLRETGSGTRRELERRLAKSGAPGPCEFKVAAVVGSSTAAKQAVKSGTGVTILSSRAVEDELRRKELFIVPVGNLTIRRNFFLVYHGKRTLSPACKAFIRFLG